MRSNAPIGMRRRPIARDETSETVDAPDAAMNQLRTLEMKDIERRLAEVRAETQRRIDKRTEFIRFAVDDIIRDAVRPR